MAQRSKKETNVEDNLIQNIQKDCSVNINAESSL